MVSLKSYRKAPIFYPAGHKAHSAASAMDNCLRNDYNIFTSDIHFDIRNYLAYFDYEKLSSMPDYSVKIIHFYKCLK